jgi:hypothetical protein
VVLKSLDILIGVAVVMLALSMTVTLITQSITTMLNSRGRHLRRGLTDLLQQLDPALDETLSRDIATRILTHPLVSGSEAPVRSDGTLAGRLAGLTRWIRERFGGARLGNVVYREEFTKLLMVLATDAGSHHLPVATRDRLRVALAANGVTDPDATLKNVRAFALQLERSHPALSHASRQTMAILHEAESDLVAKINSWFDQSMDRTSQRFTASTRLVTFAGALIVAVGLQVDTLSLVNRLAADDTLRNAFVERAVALDANAGGAALADGARRQAVAREYTEMLSTFGIVRLPSTDGWWRSLQDANLFGLLITALLLSLGAPFWYSQLSRLLQLRSVLAAKDDAQRRQRQTTETEAAVPAALAAASAAPVTGERGDPLAVG